MDWLQVGETLKGLDRALPWMVGDWLNFGEQKYGETYSQGMDLTGLEYQTLANEKYVSSRFEISRRRESLSFSHHAEGALEPAPTRTRSGRLENSSDGRMSSLYEQGAPQRAPDLGAAAPL